MHRSHALQGEVVVHDREHAFLHFAAVPGVDDYLHALGEVEGNAGFGVDAEFLPVLYLGLRGVEHYEVGGEGFEFLFGGADEHVGYEVGLPCNFNDEANGQTGVLVGAAESVDNVEGLVAELLVGDVFQCGPGFGGDGLVVVLVFVGCPPDGVAAGVVHNEEFILGRAAGVDAGHYVDGAKFGFLTFFVAGQFGFGLVDEELVPRGIVENLGGAHDSILSQINLAHSGFT